MAGPSGKLQPGVQPKLRLDKWLFHARFYRTRPLAQSDFSVRATGTWKSTKTAAVYPSGWVLSIPSQQLELTLEPTVKDQELVAANMGGVVYWEGSVRVRAISQGARVAGQGYVELTDRKSVV